VRAKSFPSPSHQSGAHSIILWMEWNNNTNNKSNNRNDVTAIATTANTNASAENVKKITKRTKIERTIAKALECNANAIDVLKLNRVQVQQFHWKFKFVRQKRTIAEIFETWQPYLLQKQRRCKNT